jgi:hypothetical protein
MSVNYQSDHGVRVRAFYGFVADVNVVKEREKRKQISHLSAAELHKVLGKQNENFLFCLRFWRPAKMFWPYFYAVLCLANYAFCFFQGGS